MNQIQLILQSQDVEPGKQLSGVLAVRIYTPIDEITLEIKGEEYVSYYPTQECKMEKKEIIMNFETEIDPQGDLFEVGDYKFPINFTMPIDAPSSFELAKGTTIARISYFLIATAGDAQAQRKILVTRRVFPWVSGKKHKTEMERIYGFCEGDKTFVSAEIEKTIYQAGDTLKGVGVINNLKSKTSVLGIKPEICFMLKIQLSGNVFQKIFKLEEPNIQVGMMEGQIVDQNIPISVQINVEDLVQTTRGSIIESKFIFKFGGFVHLLCGDPVVLKVSREIGVFKKNSLMLMNFEAPNEWNPQQAQPYSFNLNLNVDYPLKPPPPLNPPKTGIENFVQGLKDNHRNNNQGRNMNKNYPLESGNMGASYGTT